MQNSLEPFKATDISYSIGDSDTLKEMLKAPPLKIFDERIMNFLNDLSRNILKNKAAKAYPDVMTFGFWCRRASIETLKKPYDPLEQSFGRGIAFHIAPSNVPVNFAYSMVVGLLAGNANIVRLPSKSFEQVEILIQAIAQTLEDEKHRPFKPYFLLVQYGHQDTITNLFSSVCDTRIIWGGDQTIKTIRRAPLKPRATEITFADRYSLAVIDAQAYLQADNKSAIASAFYNDTYLTDQNACTSPRIVFWIGQESQKAREIFWEQLYQKVKTDYTIQPVQAVGKRTSLMELAATHENTQLMETKDNRLIRIQIDQVEADLMQYRNHSGYFMECVIQKLEEMLPICNQSPCQTLSYYGPLKEKLMDFIFEYKPKGIDRVVPIGKTMDFELVWDGYDLIRCLSRIVK